MAKRKVRIDKSFFIKERDTAYDNWHLAWWREHFQNSTDAGAKTIRINMDYAPARGALAGYRHEDRPVVRIVFADDGHGMTHKTLEDVYFRIGQSTKVGDETMVGGFGRARIMTSFAQDRYSILTGKNFVMGDGDDFDIFPFDTALTEIDSYMKLAAAQSSDVPYSENRTLQGLQIDKELVENAKMNGGYKGCRIEVDLETWETPGHQGNRPASLQRMEDTLKTYLSESQIKADVIINGKTPQEFFRTTKPVETRKGRAKTVLTAGQGGAAPEEFAKVYVVKKDDETASANMIVRVDGASMFSDYVYNLKGVDVVVEIAPKLARQVLNSNRDGLHAPYRVAVNAFKEKLAIETKSALADEAGIKQYTISGEHGTLKTARKPLAEIMRHDRQSVRIMSPRLDTKPTKVILEVSQLREADVSFDESRAFVKAVRNGNSFLNAVQERQVGDANVRESVNKLISAVNSHSGSSDEAEKILVESCPPELISWVVEEIKTRVDEANKEVVIEHDKKLANLHDTVISVETTNPKTKPMVRKYDPRNWSFETGKGKRAHAMLAAWTTAIAVANEALVDIRPLTPVFAWRTGFIFSVEKLKWENDDIRPTKTWAAMDLAEDNSEIRQFFLNPIHDDGRPLYKVTDDKDVWSIISKAIHEVTHVLEGSHDQDYANLQTDLTAAINPVTAIRRVKQGVAAAMAAYGGRSTVVPLDNEQGTRPAERLRRLSTGNEPKNAYFEELLQKFNMTG